jgi:hypothetical protein
VPVSRENRTANLIITGALVMIAAAFAAYATLVLRWFSAPQTAASGAGAPDRAAADAALADARRAFRDDLLDPRAHLRLSEALWKDGRPVDSFYVAYAARRLFADADYRTAQAQVVLGAGGPAAALLSGLKDARDGAGTVSILAEAAREYPDSLEGRRSLDRLSQMAQGAGRPASLAREALQRIVDERPRRTEALAALAGAAFARGDASGAYALAREALNKNPAHAGAARIMGMLSLKDGDVEGAVRWLTLAWDGDPDDLYSAAKLAQIYDRRRADADAALPYYLALYRQNPDYSDGEETAETRIREILDARRERLLKDAPVESLGARFKLDDASLRAQAALRAAVLKDPRWIDSLGDLLDDDTRLVRRAADYALYQIAQAEPGAVRARRDAWLASDKPLVRIRALNLFADLDGVNVLPALSNALRDPNPGVRAFAKVMVLDHYFMTSPRAAALRARYKKEETDPRALAFERRFEEGTP